MKSQLNSRERDDVAKSYSKLIITQSFMNVKIERAELECYEVKP
jgi:hypothetical protein